MTHAKRHLAIAAEIVSLWQQLLAAQTETDTCRDAYNAAAEAAQAECAPRWSLHSIEHFPSRAVFICARRDMLKTVPLRSRDIAKMQDEAERIAKRFDKEYFASAAKAERRHGVKAKERAYTQAIDKVSDLVEQIAEAPAHGLTDAAIKLAAAIMFERDALAEPALGLITSAYRAIAQADGTDYAAQAKPWGMDDAA